MSLIKAIKAQLGLSVTPSSNFTLDASADNGTMKLARNSGQDIMTVDAAGKATFALLGGFDASKTASGYQKLPSGLIIQWGLIDTTLGQEQITWPIQFPTAVLACVVTPMFNPVPVDLMISLSITVLTTIGVIVDKRYCLGTASPAPSSTQGYVIAIGY